MGLSKLSHLILILGCGLLINNIFSCSSTSSTPSSVKTNQSTTFKPFQHKTTLASGDTEKAADANSNSYQYWYIYNKLVSADFTGAVKDLNRFTEICYYPQRYGLEALMLKLCLLGSLRKSYLTLGTVYQQGWKQTISSDKSLSPAERIARLANLSRSYLTYYRKHKETTIALISAYNTLMQIYPDLSPEQLRFVGQPFEKHNFIENPYLAKIRQGNWLETNSRTEVEKTEFNNSFLSFLSGLLGTKNIQATNALLQRENITLDKYGFLFWLSQSLKHQTSSGNVFADEPALAKILNHKSAECHKLLERILAEAKGKKISLDRFNPLSLMK